MIDGCFLPAKVNQTEQLTHPKEDPAFVAPGNGYPASAAVASSMNCIGLRSTSHRRGHRLRSWPHLFLYSDAKPGVNRNRCCTFTRRLYFPGEPASFVALLREDGESLEFARSWILRRDQDTFFEIDSFGRRCPLKPVSAMCSQGDRSVLNESPCVSTNAFVKPRQES